jgi:hypothetical protein
MGNVEYSSSDAGADGAPDGRAPHGEANTIEIRRADAPFLDSETYVDDVRPEALDRWDDDSTGEIHTGLHTLETIRGSDDPRLPPDGRSRHRAEDDDPAHRRAMVVWRSALGATAALVLALVIVSVVTTVGNSHSGSTAAANTAGGASSAPDGVAPGATVPPLSDPAADATPLGGMPAAPTGGQPVIAAGPLPGAGPAMGGAPATAQPGASTPRPAGGKPTGAPTTAAPRCDPVEALLLFFWTLLGIGPCGR